MPTPKTAAPMTRAVTFTQAQVRRAVKAAESAGLTSFMKTAAAKAGLPAKCVPHGLRKAGIRRMAEAGKSVNQIAAVSGHKSLREVQRYTEAADQRRLARDAMGNKR